MTRELKRICHFWTESLSDIDRFTRVFWKDYENFEIQPLPAQPTFPKLGTVLISDTFLAPQHEADLMITRQTTTPNNHPPSPFPIRRKPKPV